MVYERVIPHFPGLSLSKELFRNLPLKQICIFFSVPISEVAPEFSHEIIIKIFQKFLVNVSKMFLTFLSKKFFNLFKVS